MSTASQTLSPCQEKALHFLRQNRENVFLTGSAGTGKSFLLRQFLKDKDRNVFPVVASTGAAAVLIGGRTFHSFFGLGIMEGGVEKTIERALEEKRLLKRLKKIQGFVLDEVSMIPGPALRAAETICRMARKNKESWGGARVVAVGDFAQLPPVNAYGFKKEWAFLDSTWEQSRFVPCVLKTVMRTGDEEYIRILHAIREGNVHEEVQAYLDAKTGEPSDHNGIPHLFPRRDMAESFNIKRLSELKGPLKEFPTVYSGSSDRSVETIRKNAPVPEVLQLKKSALVMIRANDPYLKYVNGSLGNVTKIGDDSLEIRLKNGREVTLEKMSFSLLNAEGKEVATAHNFPVALAYAMTIHKAQGATMDGMVCDLKGLWEPGQAYVALSRLRTGAGLKLTGWDAASIRVDPQVVEFHRGLEAMDSQASSRFFG